MAEVGEEAEDLGVEGVVEPRAQRVGGEGGSPLGVEPVGLLEVATSCVDQAAYLAERTQESLGGELFQQQGADVEVELGWRSSRLGGSSVEPGVGLGDLVGVELHFQSEGEVGGGDSEKEAGPVAGFFDREGEGVGLGEGVVELLQVVQGVQDILRFRREGLVIEKEQLVDPLDGLGGLLGQVEGLASLLEGLLSDLHGAG